MSLRTIIGQERAQDVLRRALTSGRVAHAYLFHGPDGVGKAAAALAFAQALQCQTPASDGDAGENCDACRKAKKGLHPDIHVLMPLTTDADDAARTERIQMLFEDPWQAVDFQSRPSLDGKKRASNKQVLYTRDHILQWLRRPMSYHPVEGAYRIAVILDADRMREEAANSFLKLLEEPGKRTVFILCTSRIDHLLPTILSRCQRVRFDVLSDAAVTQGLTQRGLPQETATMLARMAGGSLRRALSLSTDEELIQTRESVLDFLRKSYQGRGDRVVMAVDSMSRGGRESVKFQLGVLLGLLRDLMILQRSSDTSLVVNIDQIEPLQRFNSSLAEARIEAMVDAVEQAMTLVERNVNVRLALVALSRVLSRAMRGDPGAEMRLDLAASV